MNTLPFAYIQQLLMFCMCVVVVPPWPFTYKYVSMFLLNTVFSIIIPPKKINSTIAHIHVYLVYSQVSSIVPTTFL